MITRAQLLKVAPGTLPRIDAFLAPLNLAMDRYSSNTPRRIAAFLAQVLHESGGLARMSENLNYSAEALPRQFNTSKITRFTAADAEKYGRTASHPANQEMIANLAYANRMGNGGPSSGDGWRYRGRGPIQLTGKDNYSAAGTALGLDLLSNPDQVALPEAGCLVAGWFWGAGNSTGRSLNLLADADKFDNICDVINIGRATAAVGDAVGYKERKSLYDALLKVLA